MIGTKGNRTWDTCKNVPRRTPNMVPTKLLSPYPLLLFSPFLLYTYDKYIHFLLCWKTL